jgi:hypothetical protein
VIREGISLRGGKGYEVGHFDHYWRCCGLLAFSGPR